jgi:hypothetical protein
MPNRIYDFAAITHAQAWLIPYWPSPRPFAYPPTSLLFLAPFGLLPFWWALGLWVSASLTIFLLAGIRLANERRGLALALMVGAPAVVLSILVGQTTLMAAGLASLALVQLGSRPRLAGLLLAISAALKPQVALLAPLALLASGDFAALIVFAVAGAIMAALSITFFGATRWTEWLSCLPAFDSVVRTTPGLMRHVIAPSGIAWYLHLSHLASLFWRCAFVLIGVALVWRAFSRWFGATARAAALLGGGLLVAPYALQYDGAAIIAPAVAMALDRTVSSGWIMRLFALLAAYAVFVNYLGGFALLAFLAIVVVQHEQTLRAAKR